MTRTPRLALIGLVALATIAAGCSSSKAVSGTGASTTSSVTSEVTTTVDGATTTVAETTTTLETTTTEPAPEPLVLRSDGIGGFHLGDEAQPVVDGLTAQLGAPASDETVEYPTADGLGDYTTADGEMGFVAPVGRTVCWANGFCVALGGATGGSMSFTGWAYREDTTGSLSSAAGVTLGTRGDEAPTMIIHEGGCYSSGSGEIDGIRLFLQSEGVPFSSFDDAGNYLSNVPPASDVVVVWMETGENPVFLYGDC